MPVNALHMRLHSRAWHVQHVVRSAALAGASNVVSYTYTYVYIHIYVYMCHVLLVFNALRVEQACSVPAFLSSAVGVVGARCSATFHGCASKEPLATLCLSYRMSGSCAKGESGCKNS